MRRPAFITLLGGAVAWPLAARAQQQAMPVIGFLDGQSFDLHLMTAFRQALKDAGYIEGRNVAIYFRSADGQTDRLVTLAGDIIGRRVAVIVTTGGGAAALAAYAATTTIPIVFVNGVDPVSSGLVVSLNRPGGNATGVYIFQQVLEGKRLGLLRELVPSAASIAVLLNPTNANFQTQLRGVQDAARDLGQQVSILSANTEREIDVAFATVAQSGARALQISRPGWRAGRRFLSILPRRPAESAGVRELSRGASRRDRPLGWRPHPYPSRRRAQRPLACGAQMGRQFRQLRAAVEIPLLRDLSADEPALHLHGRLAARARALLPARRHACGGRLVPASRARARVFEAVLLELSARRPEARMARSGMRALRPAPGEELHCS